MSIRFSNSGATRAYALMDDPRILTAGATNATVGFWIFLNEPDVSPPASNDGIIEDNGKFIFRYSTAGGFQTRWYGQIGGSNNLDTINIDASDIPYEQWKFVTATFEGSVGMNVFVDGISVATDTTTLENLRLDVHSTRFMVGHTVIGTSGVTTGYAEYSGFFAVDRLLTPTQISNIFSGSLDPQDIPAGETYVIPMNGRDTGDTLSADDESIVSVGSITQAFDSFVGTSAYIDVAPQHTWGIVSGGEVVGDVNLPSVGGVAGGWGLTASTANRPLWLGDKIMKSAVLTKRGWETRLPGTDNPEMMEVVVAGSFGSTVADNQAPEIYEGAFPLTRELSGISGAEISPYFIEIVDPDSGLEADAITPGTTAGLPAGLVVEAASATSSPVQMFRIVGTADFATSGTATLQFTDAGGSSAVGLVNYNIIAP